jgi:hypothetical protein
MGRRRKPGNEMSAPATINRGPGAMKVHSEMPHCTTDTCGETGVVVLAGEPLCLGHFLQGCYQRLERFDPVVRGKRRNSAGTEGAPNVLEDLVKQVLIVCLQRENLSNRDRSRLLDILLWAGELQFLLRVPHGATTAENAYGMSVRSVPRGQSLSEK